MARINRVKDERFKGITWSGGQDLNLRHTGFCEARCLFCMLDRLGDPTTAVVEVYSVSVTMQAGGSEALPS